MPKEKKKFKKEPKVDVQLNDIIRDEELQKYKDGWLRAQADYQNLQREIDQKRSDWVKMSEIQVLERFIPVYDNFCMAFSQPGIEELEDKQMQNWVKGIEYIKKQFEDVLDQHTIEIIKTVGEKFDPTVHEAVSEEEHKDLESGTILKELHKGYKMGEIIIRPAKVIVVT